LSFFNYLSYPNNNNKYYVAMTPKITPIILLLLAFLSSCVSQRELEYLQDKNENIKAFKEAEYPDYRLKPNDELYIQVNSLDDAGAKIFSNERQDLNNIGSIQPYGASLISYTIDKDGFLLLPVIGKILVKDRTVSEVVAMIKDSMKGILNQPIVTVKLVNRYVSVLGEVNRPGHFPYSQDKLTIYDALGFAGDIGDYGNRETVLLIRNENGQNNRINVNLNNSEILSSNYYYLRPNDIVYVKPMKEKFWGLRQFPYAVIISTITTAILLYSVLQ
jgi:polysaccharide biosynthesis/export protein